MKKSPFYYDPASAEDITSLCGIQIQYLSTTLTSEERYQEGFLSYAIPPKTLKASLNLKLLRIAARKRTNRVTGFAVGMSAGIAGYVNYLRPVIIETLEYCDYPCFIQICVEHQNRKKNIGSKLLEGLLFEISRQAFKKAFINIPRGNDIAKKFFEKRGFYPLVTPLLSDCEIFCIDLDAIRHQNKKT